VTLEEIIKHCDKQIELAGLEEQKDET